MAEPQVAAGLDRVAPRTRPPEEMALDLIALATLAATAVGLRGLVTGPLAWDARTAIDGVTSQLATTLPAAVLVLLATAVNLAAGGVLARLAVGRPFGDPGRTVLGALVGAVLLDTAALFVLGGLAWFRAPVLFALHVAILALGLRARPILEPATLTLGPPRLAWVVVGVGFVGAALLQLASPVVPFLDVLPNHVAPVERLRTFGEFAVLTETPSPIYGPSRTFLGYVALLGTITTLTGLPAALAVSAFILPGALLVALAVHRFAIALGGPSAGLWGLLAFTLTATFGRLTDVRATVLVLPVALAALAWVVERHEVSTPLNDAVDTPVGPPPVRAAILLGGALGAAILVHPVVGALTAATVGLVSLMRPAFAWIGVPAVAVGGVIAMPQAATMIGLDLPSWVAIAVVPSALVAGRLLASDTVGFVAVLLGRAALLALVPVVLVGAWAVVNGTFEGLREVIEAMPLLVLGSIAAVVIAPRRVGHPVVVSALAAGVVMGVLTQLVPEDGGLLTSSIRFELPKTLHYWLPVFAALVTALGLQALWRRDDLSVGMRTVIVGAFLVVAALPIRSAEEDIDDLHLGEHRFAETLAVDLRWAGRGFWATYPDPRRVVDRPREELLDVVRAEIAAGRIDGRTELLHVAPTFQQWVATPFGVFTGVRETVVSPDAEETIHTVGGSLRTLDRLDELIGSGTFAYLVLEPGDGLPGDVRERIEAAGYASLFVNGQGEVFRLGAG